MRPEKVLKGSVGYVIPAQRAIMKGRCGGWERLKDTVEHISQVVMEFRRSARRVLFVAKVILFQRRVGRTLIEKGLDPAVNVNHENIFFALCNVD